MEWECGGDCEVTECVLVRVFDLTASPDLVVDSVSVSFPWHVGVWPIETGKD